jgi:hypothetical protein
MAAAVVGCGSNGVAPGSFELVGDWQGDLLSTSQVFPGAIGDFVITLVGEEDGQVEEYSGEGILTGNQFIRRFRNVQGEYNTSTGEIEIVILDLSTVGNTFRGSFQNGSLFIADSTICGCEAFLTRGAPAAE